MVKMPISTRSIVLRGQREVAIVIPPKRERRGRRGGGATPNPVGNPLFEALRALRKELAEEAGVPPYVIFHDSTLREMALARPDTLARLGQIGGVGAKKLEAYGDRFLRCIVEN